MNDQEQSRREAHLARRGKPGPRDQVQRKFDMLRNSGSKWYAHPDGSARGMWCPPQWFPDWERDCPVIEIKMP